MLFRSVALQVGTYQEELSIERSQECRDAGEGAYDLLAYASNSDAATNVAGGKGDILMADSPVTAYAITRSRGTRSESTRLNSSHVAISYAVFCLKKKKATTRPNIISAAN